MSVGYIARLSVVVENKLLPPPPPPLLDKHEPLIKMHPPENAIPLAKVEVAVVLVILRALPSMPPANVEVAFVSPRIVVVAARPTKTESSAARRVDDAWPNVVKPETLSVEYKLVAPVACSVEDANNPPVEFTKSRFEPIEFCI